MIRNPFTWRGMIKSDRAFWGRTTELASVYSCLLDSEEQPQSVAIIGQRRIGKSSLLYRIFKQLSADEMYRDQMGRMTCIMLSMQDLTSHTPEQFFHRTLHELTTVESELAIKTQEVMSTPVPVEEQLRFVLRWIDQQEWLLVMILDEFECAAENPHFDKAFFDKLRSFAQQWRLAFVIALHCDLDQLWDEGLISSPYSSPFFNFFQTVSLRGFHENETAEYLRVTALEAGIELDDDEVDTIRRAGGNHPFFVNVAAYHLCQRMSLYGNGNELDQSSLLVEISQDPTVKANMHYYWRNLSIAQRKALLAVANDKLEVPTTSETQVDLAWLERMSLIERRSGGEYTVFSDTFREYLLTEAVRSQPDSVYAVAQDIHTIVAQDESATLEFKSSLRWDYILGRTMDRVEDAVVKTLAAFLNTDGGTLIIGIDDSGNVLGLQKDYGSLKKPGRDAFQLYLMQLISNSLEETVCQYLHVDFHKIDGEDVCRVTAKRSPFPVFSGKERTFFVRRGNSTQQLNAEETVKYVARRWQNGVP